MSLKKFFAGVAACFVSAATLFSFCGTARAADNAPDRNGILGAMSRWPVTIRDEGGTLLFSDSPEYVTENGILYSDTVTGKARIFYYHLNESPAPKKLSVIFEREGDDSAKVMIERGGESGPDKDFLRTGKSLQNEYFASNNRETLVVAKDRPQLLRKDMNKKSVGLGELVCGMYDFSASRPVKVTVLMCDENEDPFSFVKTAKVLPKDKYRLRGTFTAMNRIVTAVRAYNPERDGIVYVPLADDEHDRYRIGRDATDGSTAVNVGNYGILYKIILPTKGKMAAKYYLSPNGGVYAGVIAAAKDKDGAKKIIPTPQNMVCFGEKKPPLIMDAIISKQENQNRRFLTKYTELADIGTYHNERSLFFEFSPPGASNLPANIIMMPAKEK